MASSLPCRWGAFVGLAMLLGTGLLFAQATAQRGGQDKPTFSVQVDLVTTDTVVRDAQDHFVPDLSKDDFEVYEDGVRQDIVTMTLVHAGRVTNVLALPPQSKPQVEGLLLP